MKEKRAFWWTADHTRIRFCFICGGALAWLYVPADKKNRLVCKKCLHITYTNPKSVAGMIPVASDGRVALLKRNIEPGFGKWTYPAGYQELGETVADAAIRETYEEICARVKVERLLNIYSYADSGVITSVFVGRLKRGEKPRPGEESQEVRLYRPSDLPWKDLAFRSTVTGLKEWLKSR